MKINKPKINTLQIRTCCEPPNFFIPQTFLLKPKPKPKPKTSPLLQNFHSSNNVAKSPAGISPLEPIPSYFFSLTLKFKTHF